MWDITVGQQADGVYYIRSTGDVDVMLADDVDVH